MAARNDREAIRQLNQGHIIECSCINLSSASIGQIACCTGCGINRDPETIIKSGPRL